MNKSYRGCQNDAGWLLVTEGGPCDVDYEPLNTLTILYSPTNINKNMSDSMYINKLRIKTKHVTVYTSY